MQTNLSTDGAGYSISGSNVFRLGRFTVVHGSFTTTEKKIVKNIFKLNNGMRYRELTESSKLCTACNGSGRIMKCAPICEKCLGYGTFLEGINRFESNLLDILDESMSMSDLAYVLEGIRKLPQVKCQVIEDRFTVKLEFTLDNIYGSIWLRPRKDGTDLGEKFRKRLTAAAIARLGGKRPASMAVTKNMLNGPIKNASIKILTNPAEMEVIGLRYESYAFGEGLN